VVGAADLSHHCPEPEQQHPRAEQERTQRADVELLLNADSPDPVSVGQQLNYTITVRNNGPSIAPGVTLTDTLPAGVTFVSASSGCSNAAGTVTCNLGAIGVNATSQVTILVTPTAAGSLSNTATVSTPISDPIVGNNTGQASTTVQTATFCTPRPAVQVQTQVVNEGGVARLRTTVTAQSSAGTPNNTLTAVQFTSVNGARVTVLPTRRRPSRTH
jgi:uncharacterized repeat protein (TIGR01451 family)